MSDHTVDEHIRAAFKLTLRHLYDQWKAERSCELRDHVYKRYDGRGFHSVSLEVGRLFALVELCPALSDDYDLVALRRNAREDAQACWREETFKEFLPQPETEATA
jgi:hypothetical protein